MEPNGSGKVANVHVDASTVQAAIDAYHRSKKAPKSVVTIRINDKPCETSVILHVGPGTVIVGAHTELISVLIRFDQAGHGGWASKPSLSYIEPVGNLGWADQNMIAALRGER